MNPENKNSVFAAAHRRRKASLKISGPVWLLAGALCLAGGGRLPAAALIWHGVNFNNNNWSTNASDNNWQSGATQNLPFNNGDSVTFNQFGSPSTSVNLVGFVQPSAITVDTSAVNYAFTNATGSIIGTGGLLVIGTGKLTLATTNSFSGGTTVSNAVLQLNSTTAAGSGPVTNSSGTVAIIGFGLPNSLTCLGTATVTNSGNTGGLGTLNGSGTLAINSPGRVFDLLGNCTGYGGTLILSNCTSGVRFNGTAGSSSATFDLGVGNESIVIRNNGTSFAIGALAGGASTILSGNNSYAVAAVFSIGGNNANTTFSGKILNGSYTGSPTTAINKVGTGTLTLAGSNNSYSGNTTVSSGVLAITGLAWPTNSAIIAVTTNGVLDVSGLAGGLVTLSSNQTLTGSGTVRGSVNAPTNAIVLPGDGVGVLTLTNTFTSAGTIFMELNRTNAAATNDQIKATSITITGGTLVVTNLGPDLHTGDSFKLFSTAIGGTGFTTVSLPASNVLNTVQYTWTNRLTLDGSVQVLSGASSTPNPTLLTNYVSGGQLVLKWPAGLNWILQVQTNGVNTGLGTNWNDVAGSTAYSSTNFTLGAGAPATFYRLIYRP